jgi:hypothetical protein
MSCRKGGSNLKINDSSWLNLKRSDVTSQNGEDGVLEAIFDRIGVRSWWCVEVGAHDGKTNSNTWNLRKNHGWTGILIEQNAALVEQCKENALDKDIIVHGTVDEVNSLDRILLQTYIPKNFDLLSIDVDGNDQNLWRSVTHYKPRVVILEVDSSILPSQTHKSGVTDAVGLAKFKGYELALHTGNCIFVQRKFSRLLNINPDRWEDLFDYSWAQNRVM